MNLIVQSNNLSDYLKQSDIIDYCEPLIVQAAKEISSNALNEAEAARLIYEFVRDKIWHSADIDGRYVTCSASDTLKRGEGICYAKSHLLAALMRYYGIPCGFCYQLLRLNDEASPLVLHGLNAIYLSSIGKWTRLDARGNKQGVDAQFSIDDEKLAFEVRDDADEQDFPYIFSEPDLNVVAALNNSKTIDELWSNLPGVLYNLPELQTAKLKIAYLADHPAYIQTCASWVYGLWACQAGASYDLVLDKFMKGANKEALPLTLIALYDSKPAGMVSLWKSDAARTDLTPWLAALYVHPFHRNKKISIALIDRLVEEAHRLGFAEIYLVTEEAKGLYSKFGWAELEQVITPYGEASLMRKVLD